MLYHILFLSREKCHFPQRSHCVQVRQEIGLVESLYQACELSGHERRLLKCSSCTGKLFVFKSSTQAPVPVTQSHFPAGSHPLPLCSPLLAGSDRCQSRQCCSPLGSERFLPCLRSQSTARGYKRNLPRSACHGWRQKMCCPTCSEGWLSQRGFRFFPSPW